MNIQSSSEIQYCLKDDIGFVSLVQCSGSDVAVVNSARVSFGKQVDSITDRDEKLIRFLLSHEHGTPLEHNSLTFSVKCPIFVARQWHRHRVGISINEISGRYVEFSEEFYIPVAFREQSSSNRQASIEGDFAPEQQQACHEIFAESVKRSFVDYQRLLDQGVAREQARAVLPLTTYTQYYWTCNLRSLFHFVRLRDHADAQYEIRQYAQSMLKLAKEHFPVTVDIWEDLGRP